MRRLVVAFGVVALGVAVLLSGPGVSGQDKEKTTGKGKSYLPIGWKKLGLSKEQLEKVKTIHNKFAPKIDQVKAQLDQLKTQFKKLEAQQKGELYKVLTSDQKKELQRMISEKAGIPEPTADKGKATDAAKDKKE
jgi:hypothetical protein